MSQRPLTVLSVVGARPNFMKIAPIAQAMSAHPAGIRHILVHTGQHSGARMSDSFFADLGLPAPDHHLSIEGGTHARQTGAIMVALEPILAETRPDLVVVIGDVNSTLAAAITAKKLNLKLAHVEAGLRSGDMSMPEEVNRRCVDAIADLLFTPDREASRTLLGEGVPAERVHFTGNVMIDTLMAHLPAAAALDVPGRLGLTPGGYAVMTLHRPSNVDDSVTLAALMRAIREAVGDLPVVFPVHPRTAARLRESEEQALLSDTPGAPGIHPVQPFGYLEFLSLNRSARLAITDSGGLQEETTVLGVPCVTVRDNTERPITVTEGTNRLAGTTPAGVRRCIREALEAPLCAKPAPEFWDGRAGARIVDIIARMCRPG